MKKNLLWALTKELMQDLLLRKLSQEQLSLILFVRGPCGHPTGLNCHDLTSPGPWLLTSALGLRTSLNWGGPLLRYMSASRLLWALSSAFFFVALIGLQRLALDPASHLVFCHVLPQPYLGNWSHPQQHSLWYHSTLRKKLHQWARSNLIEDAPGGSQFCLQRSSCLLPHRWFQIPIFTFFFLTNATLILYHSQSSLDLYPSTLHSFSLQTHHVSCIPVLSGFPFCSK